MLAFRSASVIPWLARSGFSRCAASISASGDASITTSTRPSNPNTAAVDSHASTQAHVTDAGRRAGRDGSRAAGRRRTAWGAAAARVGGGRSSSGSRPVGAVGGAVGGAGSGRGGAGASRVMPSYQSRAGWNHSITIAAVTIAGKTLAPGNPTKKKLVTKSGTASAGQREPGALGAVQRVPAEDRGGRGRRPP